MELSIFMALSIIAITVEGLVEYGSGLIFERKINLKQLAAAILGIALAILAKLDLYALIGIPFGVPIVGNVLTGLVLCRGANYLSDFITRLQSYKK